MKYKHFPAPFLTIQSNLALLQTAKLKSLSPFDNFKFPCGPTYMLFQVL